MRRLAFTVLLLALASAYGAAKDETVDELKSRFEKARPEDRAELCIRIAQQQLRNADKLYNEGKVSRHAPPSTTSLPTPKKRATPPRRRRSA